MLNKNNLDKKLRNYIREHSSSGYSKEAIKKVLIRNGYNPSYVDGLLKKNSETEFIKRYAVIVSLIFLISFFSFNFISLPVNQDITAYAVNTEKVKQGCCTSICQQTLRNECYGNFSEGRKCNELDECNIACCIDKEGYCLTNYLQGNCILGQGTSINKDCADLIFCSNITDKPFNARIHGTKYNKGDGILELKPFAAYYKSNFNLRYYVYDNANAASIAAEIKDNQKLVDSVSLYDDGFHNDGAAKDNIYGNNWPSSRINPFDGIKKLDINIIVKYIDGTKQSLNQTQGIVVLSNNKCLPIYKEWDNSGNKDGIIFAADHFENLSDGFQKFESSAKDFLDMLFSIEKFSSSREDFNIYRFEKSLSYANSQALLNSISNSCPNYPNKKNYVIILDYNENYCTQESPGIARVNPQILISRNISNGGVNDSLANLCDFIVTPRKLADQILSFQSGPKIIVNTLSNITYSTNKINISFNISAINYPIEYTIYDENGTIAARTSNNPVNENLAVILNNGTSQFMIWASDKNQNDAFVQLTYNATIQ